MPKTSAGLLMYKISGEQELLCFLGHPGGPYFKNKQKASWGIPKGLVEGEEELQSAAIREFEEETGIPVPTEAEFIFLDSIRYKNGKRLHAWAFEGSWDEKQGIQSNEFEIEWPPKTGQLQLFPEIDQGRWMGLDDLQTYIHPAQWPLIYRLNLHLAESQLIQMQEIPEAL